MTALTLATDIEVISWQEDYSSRVETRFAEAHPSASQPGIEQAACISLIHAFQNRRITSALHPANAQVQDAHRPPGMGYGATNLAIVRSFRLRASWRIQRPITSFLMTVLR
jgi:hypothetical protein